MIGRSHLVQPKHFSSRVVELVMVDFDVCKCCIELDINVALPWRKLEGCHGGCGCKCDSGCGGGVSRSWLDDVKMWPASLCYLEEHRRDALES
jgi:hypothetical protein